MKRADPFEEEGYPDTSDLEDEEEVVSEETLARFRAALSVLGPGEALASVHIKALRRACASCPDPSVSLVFEGTVVVELQYVHFYPVQARKHRVLPSDFFPVVDVRNAQGPRQSTIEAAAIKTVLTTPRSDFVGRVIPHTSWRHDDVPIAGRCCGGGYLPVYAVVRSY
jgi:hypothetical protein